MAITRTSTTLIAWAEINDHGTIDLSVHSEIVATRAITPAEALQLAGELTELAAQAVTYATETAA